MEIEFPVEFLVRGTPLSLQAKRKEALSQWKERVKSASREGATNLIDPCFADESSRLSVTLYYFPDDRMPGDVDNIVKPILDAMCQHIYVDDAQVERVVVQKFEPGNVFPFSSPSEIFSKVISGEFEAPVLYVRVSNEVFEDLR